MKLEAKLKEDELIKQKMKRKISVEEVEDQPLSDSTSNNGQEEIHKAEGFMRSNSSFVEMNQNNLTKRMKDDSLDHSKVLSDSKHPITRICLTGGPCAGKTTALATLSTVLSQLGFKVL